MMYGIGEHLNHLSLAPWRIMFLLCGAITIFAGILFFCAMPSGPDTAWFLTPSERRIASQRLFSQHDGGDKTSFSPQQFSEAFFDLKTFHVFLFGLLVTFSSPVLTFASLVIKNLGYTPSETLLYGSPSGAIQILFIWLGIAGCIKFPQRRNLIVLLLCIVPLTGCILLTILPPLSSGWGIIIASWLASVISSQFSILMSLSASNVRGNTKKACVNAVFFVGYSTGCIAAPQLWTQPPRYRAGVICALVDWGLVYLVVPSYWYLCWRDNRQREREAGDGIGGGFEEGADRTDKEDRSFRYTT